MKKDDKPKAEEAQPVEVEEAPQVRNCPRKKVVVKSGGSVTLPKP